jgi:two-component system, OmpR family, sensor histidine kinase MprB
MTFRRRIALLAGVSFVVAVIVCSVVGFATVRRELMARIDSDLEQRVAEDPLGLPELAGFEQPRRPGRLLRGPRPVVLPTDVLYQTVTVNGRVANPADQAEELPVDERDVAIAADERGSTRLRTVRVDDERYRMITVSTGRDVAVQIARPLSEVDETLTRFGASLVVVSVVGTALAAAVGWWVARRSARPVAELTVAAERVTDALQSQRDDFEPASFAVATRHDDEIGRLSSTISQMLIALKQAREQQRRLVVDASHEFRTPLTSLRANVEMLERSDLDESTRADIVSDVRAELENLSALSAELVELATDRRTDEDPTAVPMLDLVSEVVERARRRSNQTIVVTGTEWDAWGQPSMLERAVQNLVDNACKWNPVGEPIEISVEPGVLTIRDHGPGIPPAERELVFERFYRTDEARSTPGSGLGLAIVRQAVTAHQGTVRVDAAPGGGALFTVELPPNRPEPD